MKTLLIEVHVTNSIEHQSTTEYPTKYEAERFAKIFNETRHYDFIDRNGEEQKLYFYTLPKRYEQRVLTH